MRERVELIQTTMGPGRVTVCGDGDSLLAIGHGAGGQSWSKDILASRDAALERGWVVALVDQPWRVAGRKVADRPPVLDDAWVPIVESLRTDTRAADCRAEQQKIVVKLFWPRNETVLFLRVVRPSLGNPPLPSCRNEKS